MTEEELARSRQLLAEGLFAQGAGDLVMARDGTKKKQVTRLGAAFGPYFHPDGQRIIFASSYPDPGAATSTST